MSISEIGFGSEPNNDRKRGTKPQSTIHRPRQTHPCLLMLSVKRLSAAMMYPITKKVEYHKKAPQVLDPPLRAPSKNISMRTTGIKNRNIPPRRLDHPASLSIKR